MELELVKLLVAVVGCITSLNEFSFFFSLISFGSTFLISDTTFDINGNDLNHPYDGTNSTMLDDGNNNNDQNDQDQNGIFENCEVNLLI